MGNRSKRPQKRERVKDWYGNPIKKLPWHLRDAPVEPKPLESIVPTLEESTALVGTRGCSVGERGTAGVPKNRRETCEKDCGTCAYFDESAAWCNDPVTPWETVTREAHAAGHFYTASTLYGMDDWLSSIFVGLRKTSAEPEEETQEGTVVECTDFTVKE